MKKCMIAILFIIVLTTTLHAAPRESFYGIRYDYMLHYQSGCVAAVVLDQWNKGPFDIGEDYGALSLGVPILMGLVKEYRDIQYSGKGWNRENTMDFGLTVLGGISGKFLSLTF